jgi:hypothetical protein
MFVLIALTFVLGFWAAAVRIGAAGFVDLRETPYA